MYKDDEENGTNKKFADETIVYNMSNDIEEAIYNSTSKKEIEDDYDYDYASKSTRKKRNIIIISAVVVFIIILVIAISTGGNKNNTDNATSSETEINVDHPKINEGLPWVYGATYGADADEKKKNSKYSTRTDLNMPYININSKDGEKANNEIKSKFDDVYSKFGDDSIVYSSVYEFYENGNILSVVMKINEIVINGGATEIECLTYNFNLDNLKLIGIEELAPKAGFNSANEALSKIREWENKQVDYIEQNPDMVAATFEGVEDGKYFLDKNGKLNFIYISLASGKYYVFNVAEPNKEIKDMYELNSSDHVVKMSKEDIDNSKKISVDKPFIYDANYTDSVQEKNINGNSTRKNLVMPFININSSDVETINNEIKGIFTSLYNKYGTDNTIYSSTYKKYENGNILSIYIETGVKGTNEKALDCYVYNIDLETLKEVNKDKLATTCGFKSITEITNKLTDWEDKQKEEVRKNSDKFIATFNGVEKGKYFIGDNGKLNFVYSITAANKKYYTAVVEANKDISVKIVK